MLIFNNTKLIQIPKPPITMNPAIYIYIYIYNIIIKNLSRAMRGSATSTTKFACSIISPTCMSSLYLKYYFQFTSAQTHTHTNIYIYIYIYDEPEVYGHHYTEFVINPEKTLCIYYDH